MLHINLALIGQAVSEEMMFEYYGNIHVYSTVSVMFISLTLTNVESRMSRDFFPWILRGISVDFA